MKPQTEITTLKIGKPAQRALSTAGIKYLEDLTKYSEQEIKNMHGVGPKALMILKNELKLRGLNFKIN